MAGWKPSFNGWALSSANVVISDVEVVRVHPARAVNASAVDGGVSPEGLLGGATIRLKGTIAASTNDGALSDWGTLLKNCRGSGSVKRGRLKLSDTATDHFFAQLLGSFRFKQLRGIGKAAVTMEFHSDDPFRRADTLVTVLETPSSSDPTVDVSFSTEFSGDAPRMPAVINLGGGWQKNDVLRMINNADGHRFEVVCSQNLTASQNFVIDSESGSVLENNQVVMEAVAGTFPYIVGGMSNELDFTGTTAARMQQYSISFWDRSW